LDWATCLRGWAVAAQGSHEDGIAQIQKGLAALEAKGAGVWRPYFLYLLGEAFMEARRVDDALSTLTQALTAADTHQEREHQAQIYRLKGELLLQQTNANAEAAQNCFERAIEIARKQSAKLFELRATTSLARLLAKQGRRGDACAMLAEIYGWFTEGFDMLDLKEAKSLLDEVKA
jgi:predicted ATPase